MTRACRIGCGLFSRVCLLTMGGQLLVGIDGVFHLVLRRSKRQYPIIDVCIGCPSASTVKLVALDSLGSVLELECSVQQIQSEAPVEFRIVAGLAQIVALAADDRLSQCLAIQQSHRIRAVQDRGIHELVPSVPVDAPTLGADLLRLHSDECLLGEHGDVALRLVSGEQVRSYSWLLRQRSSYFAKLLAEAPLECDSGIPVHLVPIASVSQFDAVVEFLLTGALWHFASALQQRLESVMENPLFLPQQTTADVRSDLAALRDTALAMQLPALAERLQTCIASESIALDGLVAVSERLQLAFDGDVAHPDTRLCVGALSVPVHRLLLIARSEYFARSLAARWMDAVCRCGWMDDSQSKQPGHGTIKRHSVGRARDAASPRGPRHSPTLYVHRPAARRTQHRVHVHHHRSGTMCLHMPLIICSPGELSAAVAAPVALLPVACRQGGCQKHGAAVGKRRSPAARRA